MTIVKNFNHPEMWLIRNEGNRSIRGGKKTGQNGQVG